MKIFSPHLFPLSTAISFTLLSLLNPQICYGASCAGWDAATCMAQKAYAAHDPKYCSIGNHPLRDCLIGLAVLEGKPEDCMKLTGAEDLCIDSLAYKRLDPKICESLSDSVATDLKSSCIANVYLRMAKAKNDPAYCDLAAQAASGHSHVYGIMPAADCRTFLHTMTFPMNYGSEIPVACECNVQN